MNKIELDRTLRKLRISGMANSLEKAGGGNGETVRLLKPSSADMESLRT